MAGELQVIDVSSLAPAELQKIGQNIDSAITGNSSNRNFVNQLAFLCSNVLASGDCFEQDMADKLRYSMLWGNLSAEDRELKEKLLDKANAQYVAQIVLQKLGNQRLMSFDLLTAINNMLNASVYKTDRKFQTIYTGLNKFLKSNRNELVRMETRMEQAERNINLLTWQTSIEYQEWDGTEYVDMEPEAQIVCLVRDFYEITKGNWSTSDLLIFKAALGAIGLNFKSQVNLFDFIQAVADNGKLKDKLLGGKKITQIAQPEMLLTMSNFKKLEKFEQEEHYLIESVKEMLQDSGIRSKEKDIATQLTLKYFIKEVHVDMNVEVELYDLCLELLFNLQQAEAAGVLAGAQVEEEQQGPVLPYPNNNEVQKQEDQEQCVQQLPKGPYPAADLVEKADEYRTGTNRAVDFKQAKVLYERAAAQGNPNACIRLGIMCEQGEGCVRNVDKAIEWYENAGSLGLAQGWRRAGAYYERSNIGMAKARYRRAMKLGDLEACYELANLCKNGNSKDEGALQEAYLKAVELGDVDAYAKLYRAYSGEVFQNHRQAMKYLEAGVEAGSLECLFEKGLYYYTNKYDMDYDKAYSLLEEAKNRGYATKNLYTILGRMYTKGQGVRIDKGVARVYFETIMKNCPDFNNEEAALRLFALDTQEFLAGKLSPRVNIASVFGGMMAGGAFAAATAIKGLNLGRTEDLRRVNAEIYAIAGTGDLDRTMKAINQRLEVIEGEGFDEDVPLKIKL